MKRGWFQASIYAMSLAVAVVLTGCDGGGGDGDGDNSGGPAADVAGTWSGTISYHVESKVQAISDQIGGSELNGTENVTFTLVQDGNRVTGSASGKELSGTVNGNEVVFTVSGYQFSDSRIQNVLTINLTIRGTYDGSAIVNVRGEGKAKDSLGLTTLAEASLTADRLVR
jgi:hypothetical protein